MEITIVVNGWVMFIMSHNDSFLLQQAGMYKYPTVCKKSKSTALKIEAYKKIMLRDPSVF